jgi:hypothetical protein
MSEALRRALGNNASGLSRRFGRETRTTFLFANATERQTNRN